MLLHLLEQEAPYDFTAAFLVQEEIGLRGAKAAAYTVNPEFALVLEATTAADIAGAEGDAKVCRLGEGPVISFMDRGANLLIRNYTVWHFPSAKKTRFRAKPNPALLAEMTAVQFMSAAVVYGHWQYLCLAVICIRRLVWRI